MNNYFHSITSTCASCVRSSSESVYEHHRPPTPHLGDVNRIDRDAQFDFSKILNNNTTSDSTSIQDRNVQRS